MAKRPQLGQYGDNKRTRSDREQRALDNRRSLTKLHFFELWKGIARSGLSVGELDEFVDAHFSEQDLSTTLDALVNLEREGQLPHFSRGYGDDWLRRIVRIALLRGLENEEEFTYSSTCRHKWDKDTSFYISCEDCSLDPLAVQCLACFEGSDHRGHEWVLSKATSDTEGCCNCGEASAWDPAGFCKTHSGPATKAPSDTFEATKKYATLLVNELMELGPGEVAGEMLGEIAQTGDICLNIVSSAFTAERIQRYGSEPQLTKLILLLNRNLAFRNRYAKFFVTTYPRYYEEHHRDMSNAFLEMSREIVSKRTLMSRVIPTTNFFSEFWLMLARLFEKPFRNAPIRAAMEDVLSLISAEEVGRYAFWKDTEGLDSWLELLATMTKVDTILELDMETAGYVGHEDEEIAKRMLDSILCEAVVFGLVSKRLFIKPHTHLRSSHKKVLLHYAEFISGHENFGVRPLYPNRDVWSGGPVNVILPLYRAHALLFHSIFVKWEVEMTSSELAKLRDFDHLDVASKLLRCQLFNAEVDAGIWGRYSTTATGAIAAYLEENHRSSTLYLDLFMLQYLCVHPTSASFVVSFAFVHFFSNSMRYDSFRGDETDENRLWAVREHFLRLIIRLVNDRTMCGLPLEERVRRDIIHNLSIGEMTYYELVYGLDVDVRTHPKFVEILDEVAESKEVMEGDNLYSLTKYSLKPFAWDEFDPYHIFLETTGVSLSMEQFRRARPSANTPIPSLRPLPKLFRPLISNILRHSNLHMAIAMCIKEGPSHIIPSALHLLSLCIDASGKEFDNETPPPPLAVHTPNTPWHFTNYEFDVDKQKFYIARFFDPKYSFSPSTESIVKYSLHRVGGSCLAMDLLKLIGSEEHKELQPLARSIVDRFAEESKQWRVLAANRSKKAEESRGRGEGSCNLAAAEVKSRQQSLLEQFNAQQTAFLDGLDDDDSESVDEEGYVCSLCRESRDGNDDFVAFRLLLPSNAAEVNPTKALTLSNVKDQTPSLGGPENNAADTLLKIMENVIVSGFEPPAEAGDYVALEQRFEEVFSVRNHPTSDTVLENENDPMVISFGTPPLFYSSDSDGRDDGSSEDESQDPGLGRSSRRRESAPRQEPFSESLRVPEDAQYRVFYCGHVMHSGCFSHYCENVGDPMPDDDDDEEIMELFAKPSKLRFFCPVCKRFNNSIGEVPFTSPIDAEFGPKCFGSNADLELNTIVDLPLPLPVPKLTANIPPASKYALHNSTGVERIDIAARTRPAIDAIQLLAYSIASDERVNREVPVVGPNGMLAKLSEQALNPYAALALESKLGYNGRKTSRAKTFGQFVRTRLADGNPFNLLTTLLLMRRDSMDTSWFAASVHFCVSLAFSQIHSKVIPESEVNSTFQLPLANLSALTRGRKKETVRDTLLKLRPFLRSVTIFLTALWYRTPEALLSPVDQTEHEVEEVLCILDVLRYKSLESVARMSNAILSNWKLDKQTQHRISILDPPKFKFIDLPRSLEMLHFSCSKIKLECCWRAFKEPEVLLCLLCASPVCLMCRLKHMEGCSPLMGAFILPQVPPTVHLVQKYCNAVALVANIGSPYTSTQGDDVRFEVLNDKRYSQMERMFLSQELLYNAKIRKNTKRW